MSKKSSLSLFFRRVSQNEKLRFVFFMEANPKHRVSDSIPTLGCAVLSLVTFFCGLAAFSLFPLLGFFGMLGFMGLVMLGTFEVLHIAYDRERGDTL